MTQQLFRTETYKTLVGAILFAAIPYLSEAKNVYWAVPTTTELVSRTPASYSAPGADTNLVFFPIVSTSGDTAVGTGVRHWKWDPAARGTTNSARLGGPIAYPFGATSGRWVQTPNSALSVPDIRLMVIPSLFPDPDGGGTNPGNPTPHFQRHIDAASTAFDPVLGRVRLDFPAGVFSCDELIWKGRVIYNSDSTWRCRKRNHSSGTANRSIMRTQRVNGMNTDPVDGAFVSWVTTPVNYANPDNWYGLSDDVTITGKGRFVFDQNGKNSSLPLCRLMEVRRWTIDAGCFEVVHNGAETNVNNWAISLSGRDVQWFSPIVRGGLYTVQDGLHICSGRNITVVGGYLESGDDAVAVEAEAAGGSTSPPDEAAENIRISGFTVNSNRARAVAVCGGVNQINVPYVNGLRVRDVVITNFSGVCSKFRQSALYVGSYQRADGIWDYTITNPGSGYRDGYYVLELTGNGGGTGARCHLKVAGGRIVRAVIAKVAGSFEFGSGYIQDQQVLLTGMGAGTGGAVIGRVIGLPNDRIRGVTIDNFSVNSGGPLHDGVEAFGLNLRGATDVFLRGSINFTQNGTNAIHRPFSILSCSNAVLSLNFSETQRGGSINTEVYAHSSVDELYFRGCTFGPMRNPGNGSIKINGSNNRRIHVQDCLFRAIPDRMTAFYLPDYETGTPDSADYLEIANCRFNAESASPVGVQVIDFVPLPGGSGNQLGHLRFVDNVISGPNLEDAPSVVQASCVSYQIDRNIGGFQTRATMSSTLPAGSTRLSIPATTYTGLSSPGNQGLGGVRISPMGAPGILHWIAPSNASSFLMQTLSQRQTNLGVVVELDTSLKPTPALRHYWSFNEPSALLEPQLGVGTSRLIFTPGATSGVFAEPGREFSGVNSHEGTAPGTHLQIVNPIGSVLEARIPTTGIGTVMVEYETRRSPSGAGIQRILYTTDGVNFLPFKVVSVNDLATSLVTLDFSGILAAENNPLFAIRMTFEAGVGGTGGDNCIDDLTVHGRPLADSVSAAFPRLSPIPVQSASTSTPFTLNLAPGSPTPSPFAFSLVSGPPGLTVDSKGMVTWTPSAQSAGTMNPVVVRVRDSGTPALHSLTRIDVGVAGSGGPSLAKPADTSVAELETLSIPLTAIPGPAGASTLRFSLSSGPAGMAVSPEGILSWTPTEAQGPGTYLVGVRVSDAANPSLGDTKTFSVTVAEVNVAPVLIQPSDMAAKELVPLSMNLAASDTDVPPQALSYSLVSGPAGLTISSLGVLSWTPNASQGSLIHTVSVKVTDAAVPPLSDIKSFTISVSKANTAPTLAVIPDATIEELAPYSSQLSASDPDRPAQILTYVLVGGPTGLTVTPQGAISWTPDETQGPKAHVVSVRVTDNGNPALSDTKTFTLNVSEANSAPVLVKPADASVQRQATLTLNLSGSDPDKPAQALSYSLVSGPPGMVVSPSGLLTWTPPESQAFGPYSATVKVTDNGTPPLSDSKSMTVTVTDPGTTIRSVWQIGRDDNPGVLPYEPFKEFSPENRKNDNPPGLVTRLPGDPLFVAGRNPTADDDFYFRGTYPPGFNGLRASLSVPNDEPFLAWESGHTRDDRANRAHFVLSPTQVGAGTSFRLTIEFPTGGSSRRTGFGDHDMVIRFKNGSGAATTLYTQRISRATVVDLTFTSAQVSATEGANSIEIVRNGPSGDGDGFWIRYDYLRLEALAPAVTVQPPVTTDPAPGTTAGTTPAPGTSTGPGTTQATFSPGILSTSSLVSSGVVTEGGTTFRSLVFAKPSPSPKGLRFVVESSSDSLNWREGETVELRREHGAKWTTISVRDAVPLNKVPTRQLRVRIKSVESEPDDDHDDDPEDDDDDDD